MSAFACCRVSGSSIRPLPTARADSTPLPWALRVTPPTAVLPPSGLKLRRRGSGRDTDPTHEQQNRRRPTTAGDPRSPTPSPSVEVLPHGDDERAEDRTERHRHPRRPPPRPVARRWHENIAELGATLTDDPRAIDALAAASDGLCTAILLDNAPADSHHIREVLRRALGSDRNDL